MELILPQWGRSMPAVGALSTTRPCGFSATPYDDGRGDLGLNLGVHVGDVPECVARNRAQVGRHLPNEPVWLTQVHGTHVIDAGEMSAATTAPAPEADASFTTRPGVVCAIMTADCLPVLLADTQGRVVGAAHAGWRGLTAGVLQKTVACMRQAGGDDIVAWLGPAIGPDRFEVGEDVRQACADLHPFAPAAFRAIDGKPGKYLADIYQLATATLTSAGVVGVTGGKFCTVSEPRRFFSFRRDGVTGRMASLIWLR